MLLFLLACRPELPPTSPDRDAADTAADSGEVRGVGSPGAVYSDDGQVVFTVPSRNATRVEVWLYADPLGGEAVSTLGLTQQGDLWSGAVDADGLPEPLWYGLRVWGPNWPWDPDWAPGSEAGFIEDVDGQGNRFNPNKLLWDPYARELSHDPTDWSAVATGPHGRAMDSAPAAPKGLVLRAAPAPAAHERRALRDTIVYEVHVRGLTMQDPDVPEALRGTYAGAALKAPYLADLGVTAVELLPVHETQNDQNDFAEGSDGDNYWGYSTLSFFAPDRRYASDQSPGGPTAEFRDMVDAFHREGIDVYIDVVYNHTGESGTWDAEGQVAPLLSWRGLDNSSFYQLSGASGYRNDNGVGPNLNAADPLARDMVIDSLVYWSEEIGVDGFRFDLAPILGNACAETCFSWEPDAPDGILARAAAEVDAHLIAEPWAATGDGYRAGDFPAGWAEWNDGYRDLVRSDQNRMGAVDVTLGALADALSGTWDRFGDDGRRPWHSVNFVVAHDGMTLADLYACNEKDNSQPWPYGPSDGGSDNNLAWDQGGDPSDQRHAARTGLALLMLSAGTPMITGGDEWLRSQRCNNNPYNLDSEGNWLDWSGPEAQPAFHHFARGLMRFRSEHIALRPDSYRALDDQDGNGAAPADWFDTFAAEATSGYLDSTSNHALAVRLDGEEAGDSAPAIYIAYNGWQDGLSFTLPPTIRGGQWHLVLDTHPWLEGDGNFFEEPVLLDEQASYLLGARSVLVLIER